MGVQLSSGLRPVATYRAGTAMVVPYLWGTRTSEYVKVGVAIISTQYGHTTCYISGAGGGSGFEGLAG